MSRLLTCSHGHQWQEPGKTHEFETVGLLVCPVCGERPTADTTEGGQETLAQESRDVTPQPHELEQTLHLPGDPAPTLQPTTPPPPPAPPLPGRTLDATLSPGSASAAVPDMPQTALDQTLQQPPSTNAAGPLNDAPDTRYVVPDGMPVAETLMPTVPSPSRPGPRRGVFVEGYEILGELGRGGMGVVWKARHLKLNRVVALKMIRTGVQAGREELLRFKREAEAVARMQHPNIVQVFEVGEHDGQPFFSLEFVDGGSLVEKFEGTGMPAREAATVVETLARAMHYAHERGIVHRDLKPANVLLTAGGTPKITDFGLAKQLEGDGSGQTGDGSILGTPSYMAPEQAQGRTREIGPPADIYALGAILYDLLTGRPPFRGETVMDTLHQVIHVDPLAPTRLHPRLPRDLETICLKCLQKEPRKRYATAEALAEDLHRFLDGEPITARATPAWERAVKWCRRRPTAASLLGLSVVLVIGVIAGSLWFAANERTHAEAADRAREKERQLKEAETAARKVAEKNFRSAVEAVDRMLTHVGNEKLAKVPGLQPIRQQLLTDAIHFYEDRFLKDKSDDPEVRQETAKAYQRIGRLQQKLGKNEEALASYRQAQGYFRGLNREKPDAVDPVLGQASVASDMGDLHNAAGEVQAAKADHGQAIDALKQLIERTNPELGAVHEVLGDAYINRANLWLTQNDAAHAGDDLKNALGLFEKLVRAVPKELAYQRKLAKTYGTLALRVPLGKPADADEWFRRAIELLRQLPASVEKDEELAHILKNRGTLFLIRNPEGKLPAEGTTQALEDLREASALYEGLVKRYNGVPEYQQLLAEVYASLGSLAGRTDKPRDTERAWSGAMPLLERRAAESRDPMFRRQLGQAHVARGIARAQLNNPADAIADWNAAIAVQTTLTKEAPDNPVYWLELLQSYCNIAELNRVLKEKEKLQEAITRLQEAQGERVEALQKRLDAKPEEPQRWDDLLGAYRHLANFWQQSGRSEDEEALRKEMLAVEQRWAEKFPDAPLPHIEQALAHHRLSALCKGRNDNDDALRHLEIAVAEQRQAVARQRQNPALHDRLCFYLLELEDHARAAQAARAWSADVPHDKGRDYKPALVLGRCIDLAAKDTKNPDAEDQAQGYADEAVRLLRRGMKEGFPEFDSPKAAAAGIRGAKDLQALQKNKGFVGLLAELDKK
jgi:serine/threonine-protein kinase